MTVASSVDAALARPAFTHQQALRVIGGISLCILLSALDQTVVVPAVPAMAAELHGFDHISWIVSAYLLTSTASTPIYGKLSDIYGRRALLLPAIILFMVASVLCAMAQTLPQLVLFRALQGVGGAGLIAMAHASIADVVAPRERGRYQAYMTGMWGLASIAGPVVGGAMTDHLSWRAIFWINVPLGIAAFLMSNRALKLLKVTPKAARIDYAGAVLLTGAITSALLVLSWGGTTYPWVSGPVLGTGALAALLLAALSVRERVAPDPLLPPRLFRNPTLVAGLAISFLAAFCMFGPTFLLPLFFQLVRGTDAASSGLLATPFLLAFVVFSYTSGQLARRLGRTKGLLVLALVCCVAGFLVLSRAGINTPGLWLLVGMIVLGAGVGLVQPCVTVTIQNAAEMRDVGIATGCMLLLRTMGGTFGTTLAGAILLRVFNQRLDTLGISGHVDLGTLQQHAAVLGGFSTAAQSAAHEALAAGFRGAFLGCGTAALAALVVALLMRDMVLRSAIPSEPVEGG
jgi:EmrB/QacA subfamily drug resistance transporter